MYRARRLDAEIIQVCVRWYIPYPLSYRDLVGDDARARHVSDSGSASVPLFILAVCICYARQKGAELHTSHWGEVLPLRRTSRMRIAKPILMVTTPIGLVEGFYECYKLAGGLLFLMVAMVGVMAVALATVIATIRREARSDAKGDRWQS